MSKNKKYPIVPKGVTLTKAELAACENLMDMKDRFEEIDDEIHELECVKGTLESDIDDADGEIGDMITERLTKEADAKLKTLPTTDAKGRKIEYVTGGDYKYVTLSDGTDIEIEVPTIDVIDVTADYKAEVKRLMLTAKRLGYTVTKPKA